jgi:hypothetical protein
MRSNRIFAAVCAAFVSVACVVAPGCESGSGEIPLAKVPPPPEGFANSKANAKMPKGASPVNVNDRRK